MTKKGRVKLLYIVPNLGLGGTEKNLFHLIDSLDRDRFNVRVWNLSAQYRELEENFKSICVPVTHWAMDRLNSISVPFRALPMLWQMRRLQPDIVHCFSFDAEILGIPLAVLARIPVRLTVRRDLGNWGRTAKFIKLKRFLNRFVTRIVANSQAVRRAAMENEGIQEGHILVIPNGVEPGMTRTAEKPDRIRKQYAIGPEDTVVTMVANLSHPVKGHRYFIEAAHQLVQAGKKVKCMIVGQGYYGNDLGDALRRQVKESRLEEVVVFAGQQQEVKDILAITDIGINASLSEGMSNSILEYMANGLPVVATGVGGNPELVVHGETGLLVKERDSKALADALLALIDKPDLRKKMGTGGKQRADQHFNIKDMAVAYQNLYIGLLRGKGTVG